MGVGVGSGGASRTSTDAFCALLAVFVSAASGLAAPTFVSVRPAVPAATRVRMVIVRTPPTSIWGMTHCGIGPR